MEDLKSLKVKNWKELAKDKNLERPGWEAKNSQRVVVPNHDDDDDDDIHNRNRSIKNTWPILLKIRRLWNHIDYFVCTSTGVVDVTLIILLSIVCFCERLNHSNLRFMLVKLLWNDNKGLPRCNLLRIIES
jgi:hypothetical protein